MDDILSWGLKGLRMLWLALSSPASAGTALDSPLVTKQSHLQIARLWIFTVASQEAGFPCLWPMLQVAPVLNREWGLSPGAQPTSPWRAWVLKAGKSLSAQAPREAVAALPAKSSVHPPLESKEGSLGLPVRWGRKPAQSPGSQTETSPVILRIPFPITTPSCLEEIGPGCRGNKFKCRHKK